MLCWQRKIRRAENHLAANKGQGEFHERYVEVGSVWDHRYTRNTQPLDVLYSELKKSHSNKEWAGRTGASGGLYHFIRA
jgi:hypothetical protein